MNKTELEERKKYLALQAFYLGVKGLVEELETKHPEFVYNSTFRKEKEVDDFKEDNEKCNVISL